MLFLPLISQGQNTFNRTYDINTSGADFVGTIIDFNGAYYLNNSQSYPSKRTVNLLKLNALGDTCLFKPIYDVANTVYYTSSTGDGLISTLDSNLLITGAKVLDTLNQQNDSIVAYLTKIDLDGNIIWEREFGQHNQSWTNIRHVLQNSDSTIMILGETNATVGSGYNDVFIKKLDVNGNVIWEKEYGAAYEDIGILLRPFPGGGYLVGGVWNRFAVGPIDADMYLLKIDENGDQEWMNFYGSDFDDGGGMFTILEDTSILLFGDVPSTAGPDRDSYIAKINALGDTLWTKSIDRSGETEYLGREPIIKTNGNLITGGYFYDATLNAGLNAWIVEMDTSGAIMWERSWSLYGGVNINQIWDITWASDGGILVCGDITSFPVPNDQMAWVMKLDSNGCDSLGCPTPWVNAIEELVLQDLDFKIYPNPSTGLVNFQFSESYQNGQLAVYDMVGNLVFNQYESSEYFTLDFSFFKKGMYLIKMIAEDRKVSVRKLIID